MRQITRLEVGLLIAVVSFGFGLVNYAYQPRRESQRSFTCQSNLKKIGLAMMQYAQDYDDHVPRAWFGRDAGPSNAKTNYKWMDAIQPYLLSSQATLSCPADNQETYHFRDGKNYGSYVINNAYAAPGDKLTPPTGQKLAHIADPPITILIGDGDGNFQVVWLDATQHLAPTNTWPRTLNHISERHWIGYGNFANFLFCDSHVETASIEEIAKTKLIRGQNVMHYFTIEND